MKKNKLTVAYDYDFYLAGIVSAVRPHKLAWAINQKLDIELARKEDEEIDLNKNAKLVVWHYLFQTSNLTFRLLRNRNMAAQPASKPFLMPEIKQFDFLLQFEDQTQIWSWEQVLSRIRELVEVTLVTSLDVSTLKSRDNLLF